MSLEQERNLIFSQLPFKPGQEPGNIPYLAVLEQAFVDLNMEIFQHGYTSRLECLRRDYTQKLLSYWYFIVAVLEKESEEIGIHGERIIILERGDETLSFYQLPPGSYDPEIDDFLFEAETPAEKHSFYVLIDKKTKQFIHHNPPEMKSEIFLDEEGLSQRKFSIKLGTTQRGWINYFESTLNHINHEDADSKVDSKTVIEFSQS